MRKSLTHAGPYRLVEHIASGGMGAVYLAERDDGHVRQRAAVKILRRGVDAEDQVRRFIAERQILASLDHPNIARLIDAGITEDQRPYFVMEYVDGEPLDRYCDTHRLSVKERVALMREVALTVDAAHRQLVVHRDLKPSNIYVTDGGRVKLLDFGIAKLLDVDPDLTMTADPGARLMTPAYASPEQITGGQITTATDVYVLGLLLYELLTGLRGHDIEGLGLATVARRIVHGPVSRPSDAVAARATAQAESADRPSAVAIAAARGTTPHRLRRLLYGDLDRIVGKALRKEPERRYQSAEAFADDLERYIKNQPVLARSDSAGYRLGKFVRRRWPVLAATVVCLVLLVAYAITVTLQAHQIARERDRARADQAKAEAITSFLVRLFQASDPSETRGDTITARELLAAGVARVDELQRQPDIQGQLLEVMGRVYQSIGKYEQAQSLFERALHVRRHALGETHPEVAQSFTRLGELSALEGRYAEAEEYLRAALALHESTRGRTSLETATDLYRLGMVLVDRGHPNDGKTCLAEALATRRRLLDAADPDIAESLSGLAHAASSVGDFVEAEHGYSEALETLHKALGRTHPRVAQTLSDLAWTIDARGRYDEAAALHREALRIQRALYGEEHPAVATSLNNLSTVLWHQRKFAEAEPLAREVVRLRTRLLGRDHPSTGTALNNLAMLRYQSGNAAAAEPVMREALAIATRRLSERHPLVLTMDTNLAAMIAAQGRDKEAERLFTRVIDTSIDALGPEHPDIATELLAYGRFLAARRRVVDAERVLLRALALRQKVLGPTHPETARAARALVTLYRSSGDEAKAQAVERTLR